MMKTLFEIAVTAPIHSTLTYALPSGLMAEVDDVSQFIGCRVLVPMSGRSVTGYIIDEVHEKDFPYRIKEIREILDEKPLFNAHSLEFFRWISNYYQHPLGEVIKTALPSGFKGKVKKTVQLVSDDNNRLTQLLKENAPDWLCELTDKGHLDNRKTSDILKLKKDKLLLKKLEAHELIRIEEAAQGTKEKREECYICSLQFESNPDLNKEPTRENLSELQVELEAKAGCDLKYSDVKTLFYYLHHRENLGDNVPRKEILACYRGAGKPLQRLCELGLLKKFSRRVYRSPLGESLAKFDRPEQLTDEQDRAVNEIEEGLSQEKFVPFLLHGVTGSGKTEVYLRSAEYCLQQDKDVLVLVPEIALAAQLEAHFVSRFGNQVALSHSGLSQGERFDQWSLAALGKVRIVIGARSAVFAPLPNIGLIIVDEEHDSGYKQEDSLRYNGRDLAVLRAKIVGCPVILGSATPAITSYFNGVQGKYRILELKNRVGQSSLPEVELIDLRKLKTGTKTPLFHEKFIEELRKNLDKQEQSLVLINRRGFSISYLCQDCGTAVECKHCKVTLTFHKSKEKLVCHYCGYNVTSRLICGSCGMENLIPVGYGTERIEDELNKLFPEAVIQRLDSDVANVRSKFLGMLKSMRNGEIDILIGTQMIAKGHHFPNVTFVGVVWADGGLNFPDFRAAEKTYQLLSQVTGRAGRGEKKGRVIIQTMRPNHYAVELACLHKYDEFYEREIGFRQRPAFPPFVRLVCLRIQGESEYAVMQTASNLGKLCFSFRSKNKADLEVLGPAPAPLEKIKDRYRYQILLKSPRIDLLQLIGNQILEGVSKLQVGKSRISFDIDPEHMM